MLNGLFYLHYQTFLVNGNHRQWLLGRQPFAIPVLVLLGSLALPGNRIFWLLLLPPEAVSCCCHCVIVCLPKWLDIRRSFIYYHSLVCSYFSSSL